MISPLPPHANGTGPNAGRVTHATTWSLICVVAIGTAFLIAAPQPESRQKQGAMRPSAVPSGTVAVTPKAPAAQTDAKAGVKIVDASADTSKPCDEQTWPYIEQRCLTLADRKTSEEKSPQNDKLAQMPLGLRDLLAGVRPTQDAAPSVSEKSAPAVDQPVGSVTAIAPTPPVKQMQASAVGLGAADHQGPEILYLSAPEDANDADVVPTAPLSRREQRQLQREQRRMEREQRRLERAERRAADPNRIVRRWSEYSYDADSGMIVIQQGSPRDRFFRNYR